MALLDEIISWSQDLKVWQRDALRRLFLNESLEGEDKASLLAMIKEVHGDAPPSPDRPEFLTVDHVAGTGTGSTVQLAGLSNLDHINGFPAGRSVQIEAMGLTVLFGENGAGKSGYARVLKNACKARRRERVEPNAFGSSAVRRVPTADISLLVDGQLETVRWLQDGPANGNLSMVSVYDSACAQDYVEDEGSPAFLPYGLGHLNRLAVAQREMQRIIAAERDAITLNPQVFASLRGDTSVGRLIAALGPDSDLDAIRQLGTLSAADKARIEELERALRNLNPEPKALALERLADRLAQAAQRAQGVQRFVTEAAIGKAKRLYQANKDAKAAYELAQRQLMGGVSVEADSHEETQTDALLSGTGGVPWKLLFEAAKRFSVEYAYPDHEFPNTEVGARCVLCQSELTPEASDRMRRFAVFVADHAARNAAEAEHVLTTALSTIAAAEFSVLDAPTLTELAGSDTDLHGAVANVTTAWAGRRAWLQAAIASDDWEQPIPDLPDGDALDIRLEAKVATLRTQAKTLRQSVNPNSRNALEVELRGLKAQLALELLLPQVEQYVKDSTKRRRLDRCHTALNPQVVSTKMTSLAKSHVTAALADAMNEELQLLGFKRRVEPELSGRTDSGETKFMLRIKGSAVDAHRVLSEGEQRAMAMALFLAEVRSMPHKSTVVFDDPSTSLDHRYRRNIAMRFVSLAQERQVLVLTHDAVFLAELNLALRRQEVTASYKSIGWDRAPGRVVDGLAWETMDTNMRLGKIKTLAQDIQDNSSDYMSEEGAQKITKGYGLLRGTIERAVREVFMNNTVQPFSDVVSVESFGAVIGHPPEEWDAVIEIYDRCCEAIDAHDTSAEHQLPLPDADQLHQDIVDMQTLIQKASVRRKAANAERQRRNEERKKPFQSA